MRHMQWAAIDRELSRYQAVVAHNLVGTRKPTDRVAAAASTVYREIWLGTFFGQY